MCELRCTKCQYHYRFEPKPWEPGSIGCGRPGFEGYTDEEDPVCGGAYYLPIKKVVNE